MTTERAHRSSLAEPQLLDKIDRLFACGVGEHVPLPQLVVVGDQSSGKSSVLEGLTGLPFPRDSGLCTRFATQITFRRSPETKISVSVIPSPNADPDHIAKLKGWKRPDLSQLDVSAFSMIMSEVHELMGLGEPKFVEDVRSTFSEDVLKLDICGPTQEHFSVVDVPGIFKKTTEGITTKADIAMVRGMVSSYMENPRSVILAVIPANVDIATQEILELAVEFDAEGVRTLGVLTKPDLVDQGAELHVVELIQGKRHALNLGWCIVKNLGQKELLTPGVDRNALEKAYFRSAAPWNGLDKDRLGVEALKVRLQEILADTIRRTFPKVRAEILRRLENAKKDLHKLGAQRDSTEQQREYLMAASVRFQKIVTDTLAAQYGASDWFDYDPSNRYVTAVVTRNETFSNNMDLVGHQYSFKDDGLDADAVEESVALSEASEPDDGSSQRVEVRMERDDTDLQAVIFENTSVDGTPKGNILNWLMQVYQGSRGFELGTFQGSILSATMKSQTDRWPALALGYISDVITMAHKFIRHLLEHVCLDKRVRTGIQSALAEGLLSSYRAAYEQVEFLLHLERQGTPATQNHYFNDNLQKRRQDRFQKSVKTMSFDDCSHGSVVRLNDLSNTHPMANKEHAVRDIKDILESYYKVARKRFVDNVTIQAADYHLVTGPTAPLRLFSPIFVLTLSPEKLEEIAGEDGVLKRRRKALAKEIGELNKGRKIVM